MTDQRCLQILHVDDDPTNRVVLGAVLDTLGHRATMASSAKEALEILATETFDVVLADIHMPDMTGVEMLEQMLKPGAPGHGTPVIAVTADVMTRTAADYRALGFAGAFSKPFLVATMVEALESALGGKGVAFQASGFAKAGIQ